MGSDRVLRLLLPLQGIATFNLILYRSLAVLVKIERQERDEIGDMK